tara:strand:+ start:4099 stop:4692 length:594 start_codon:yes stop_codon:yes gene_type:complete
MNHRSYLGDLIGGSLMIRESQLIADLLLQKPSTEKWHHAISVQNILQKSSIASAKRNAATIRKRLEGLNTSFLHQLAQGHSDEIIQLMFAATLINSKILADFMRYTFADAKRMYRESLAKSDWQYFWEERVRLHPELNTMTESSVYKMSQVAFKILADAGYIENTRNKRLMHVYLLPEVKTLLGDLNRYDIIQAMEP